MFAHIPDRDHYPYQIYTHGHDQMQLMARGYVVHKHHYGHESGSDWAAYYELAKEDEQVKMKKCHIIFVGLSCNSAQDFVLNIRVPGLGSTLVGSNAEEQIDYDCYHHF